MDRKVQPHVTLLGSQCSHCGSHGPLLLPCVVMVKQGGCLFISMSELVIVCIRLTFFGIGLHTI